MCLGQSHPVIKIKNCRQNSTLKQDWGLQGAVSLAHQQLLTVISFSWWSQASKGENWKRGGKENLVERKELRKLTRYVWFVRPFSVLFIRLDCEPRVSSCCNRLLVGNNRSPCNSHHTIRKSLDIMLPMAKGFWMILFSKLTPRAWRPVQESPKIYSNLHNFLYFLFKYLF